MGGRLLVGVVERPLSSMAVLTSWSGSHVHVSVLRTPATAKAVSRSEVTEMLRLPMAR
jgi:hypothetical protein